MAQADLHLHTTSSDGKLSPEQIVALAAGRGVRYLGITDHDSTEGIDRALEAAKAFPNLVVIPGIEMSTDIPHAEVHVLGYCLDYHDQEFQDHLLLLREGRVGRAKKMLEKLSKLGVRLDWARVQELAGDGSVGRPHIAQAMVEKGYVHEFKDAFSRYIGRDGPAYADRYKMTPVEAVALIARKGGLPVLAHPAEHPSIIELLPPLIGAGLVGIEVYYGGYTPDVVHELLSLADDHGLIPTGGSDFHGLGGALECEIGGTDLPLDCVLRLLDLASWKNGAMPSAASK